MHKAEIPDEARSKWPSVAPKRLNEAVLGYNSEVVVMNPAYETIAVTFILGRFLSAWNMCLARALSLGFSKHMNGWL